MLHTYRVSGRPGLALLLFCLLVPAIVSPAQAQRRGAVPEPVAAFHTQRDTIYWLEGAPFTIPVTLAPRAATLSFTSGTLLQLDIARHLFLASIAPPPEGVTILNARSTIGGRTAETECYVVTEKPRLRAQKAAASGSTSASGIDAWGALTARVGEVYDPSTEFNNPNIPVAHYQTVVTIKGTEVLNKPGLFFRNMSHDMQQALTIRAGTRPEDIVTQVYWRPNGTADQTLWLLLLSNQENTRAHPAGEAADAG